jgi:protein SCO1/2
VWLLVGGSLSGASLIAGVFLLIARSPSDGVASASSGPPVLAQVPSFSAVRQDGTTVTDRSWAGSVWVANFIFTRCPTGCPTLTAKMAALQALSQRRLPELKLVTFTVDPEYDTPERLTAYGRKHQADFGRWTFLNPPKEVLEKTITPGFLQTLDRGDANDLSSWVHSTSLVLVDRSMRIRGVYAGGESDAIEAVMRDAEAVAGLPEPSDR